MSTRRTSNRQNKVDIGKPVAIIDKDSNRFSGITERSRKGKERGGSLSIYYTNSRSARNKMDELRLVASAGNIDVFAITETWFNSKRRDMPAECHIQGFKLFQVDRSIGKGGGVALYVRDRLNCCILIKTGIKSEVTHTESVWIEFSEGHEKLILGVIYRPPNLDRDQGRLLWEEIVRATMHDNVVILGDFNFSHIDWNFLTGNLESYDFLEVVQDCFLKQFVTEPTRGNNLLDLVLANNESLVNYLEVSEELGASDHKSITFRIEWKYDSRDNSVTVPDFRLADYDGLREHLSSVDWGNEESYQYDSFLNTIHAAQRTFIPDHELRFKVYRKPTNQNDLLHFYSHHDTKTKRGVIIGFFLRALRICSNEFLEEECTIIEQVFSKLHYPRHFIRDCRRRALNIFNTPREDTAEKRYIVLPNNSIAKHVSNIFAKTSFQVSTSTTTTIKDITSSRQDKPPSSAGVIHNPL
nr:uncharacterized protein LOC128689237 [Cherax quadricarinatus]